jgi:hypothetical protein
MPTDVRDADAHAYVHRLPRGSRSTDGTLPPRLPRRSQPRSAPRAALPRRLRPGLPRRSQACSGPTEGTPASVRRPAISATVPLDGRDFRDAHSLAQLHGRHFRDTPTSGTSAMFSGSPRPNGRHLPRASDIHRLPRGSRSTSPNPRTTQTVRRSQPRSARRTALPQQQRPKSETSTTFSGSLRPDGGHSREHPTSTDFRDTRRLDFRDAHPRHPPTFRPGLPRPLRLAQARRVALPRDSPSTAGNPVTNNAPRPSKPAISRPANGRIGPRVRHSCVIPASSRAAFPARRPAFFHPAACFLHSLAFCVDNSGPAPVPFSARDPGPPFWYYLLSVFDSLNGPYSRLIVAERDERCLSVLLMFLLQLAPR